MSSLEDALQMAIAAITKNTRSCLVVVEKSDLVQKKHNKNTKLHI
jgi:hypothetical protein